MPKVPVTAVTNLEAQTSALTAINANFDAIEAAFDEVLFRTGTGAETDNALEDDLDMNDQRIINLPEPLDDTEPVRLVDLGTWLADAEAAATAAETAQAAAELAETNAETAETNAETAEANAEQAVIDAAAQVALAEIEADAAAASAAAAAQSAIDAEAAVDVEIGSLNDVTITGAATGDVLMKSAGDWTNQKLPWSMTVAASDEVTALEVGDGKITFRMPHAVTLTTVRASLTTASTSGAVTLDVTDGGTTIFSTLLTIDQDEKTSTTAATPAVLSDTALADDAEIQVNIDGAGTDAAGLKVTFIGTR